MACRGFLQCLLKLFNLALALVGVLLLVFSLSLLLKETRTPPAPSPAPSSVLLSPYAHEAAQTHPRQATLASTLDARRALGSARQRIFLLGTGDAASKTADLAGPGSITDLNSSSSSSSSSSGGSGRSSRGFAISVAEFELPRLWFTYLLLGTGTYLTLLSLVGAVAAETNFACCLSTYQFGLCLLVALELASASLIWMEEVPDDPTGEYERRKQFVETNLELSKLCALILLLAEVSALLLAMLLRAIQADEASTGDDEEDYIVVPRRHNQMLHQPSAAQRRLSYAQSIVPAAAAAPHSPQLLNALLPINRAQQHQQHQQQQLRMQDQGMLPGGV